MKQLFIILSSIFFVVSCKTAKTTTPESSSETAVFSGKKTTTNAFVGKIAKDHYSLFNNFKTLKINTKVDYRDSQNQFAPNVEIQMEKGKQILLSTSLVFFSVKAYFTPERASFYDTYNGVYYDGNYNFISEFLGTEVTYENVENLLLGKAFYNLNEYDYTKEDNNLLELKINQFLVKLILGNQNEIASTEVKQVQNADKLVVSYPVYQTAEDLFLPKEINIHAMQKNDVQINIDYRKVTVNPPLDFRYQIPKNSKEISI